MKKTYRSIKKIVPLFLVAMAMLVGGCKDGAVGPKGETGEAGAAGPAGEKGAMGSLGYKIGFVSGMVTGMGQDGKTPINETFKFEFIGNQHPVLFTETSGRYNFEIGRFDSLGLSYIVLEFNTSKDFFSTQFNHGRINLEKREGNNAVKTLYGRFNFIKSVSAPKSTITDLKYNSNTGVLTGNYTLIVDNEYADDANDKYSSYSSTDQPFTVQGSFSVICRKANY